jgi:DNA-binding PadR family transcriptional regulator
MTRVLLRCTIYSVTEQHAPSLAGLGRFSEPSVLVLASLAQGPKHGYAIMQDIAAFHGARLEPGTLYGVLGRLEPRGLIESLPEIQRRRPYRLTNAGAMVLRAHLAALQRVVETAQARLSASGVGP